jgi:hypothetical protein
MSIDLGIDEGGSGDVLLVSAQVGITAQAKKLKKSWKNRLPESLPYFHSVDFDNRTAGVFAKSGLDMGKRGILLHDLCSFIHCRLIAGITVRMSVAEYQRLTTNEFRSRHGTAYGMAVDMCLLGAYYLAKEYGAKPEFNILIEKGHRHGGQAAQMLERLCYLSGKIMEVFNGQLIPDLKILTAGLGEKKDHPILQCADMLAYSEWQKIRQGDLTIWSALQPGSGCYRIAEANCDVELINGFVNEGASMDSFWNEWKVKDYEAKRRVSDIQPNDGHES